MLVIEYVDPAILCKKTGNVSTFSLKSIFILPVDKVSWFIVFVIND